MQLVINVWKDTQDYKIYIFRFAVTAEMVEPFLEGKTMEDAMKKKKLYLMDLTYMSDIECSAGRKVSY